VPGDRLGHMTGENLLGIPATLLADDSEVTAALAAIDDVTVADLADLVKEYPKSSLLWAMLAEEMWGAGAVLPSYAYARVGYHRGLDALRKGGWKGQGPIPWSHEPNRGVLLALFTLRRASEAFGEQDEVDRLTDFLAMSDRSASDAIEESLRPAAGAAPVTSAFIIRGED
jgi:hypothetical protein